MNAPAIQYKLTGVSNIGSCEQNWRSLESRSDLSIFLSWEWISCWAKVMSPDLLLCTVEDDEKIIAMGFFALNRSVRHSVLIVNQLRLHTMGSVDKDQIWPEYNGLLIERGKESAVYEGLVGFLESDDIEWDELVFGPADKSIFESIKLPQMSTVDLWRAPTYGVDLTPLREQQLDFITTLSKNTRQQIRRSISHYCQRGELALYSAGTLEEAQQYLQQVGEAHKERWGQESGFYNEYFVSFHQQLVKACFESGLVELLKLEVGGETLGYLYNFIYKNNVYFYLSGIYQSSENKLKPGLVLHAMSINRYILSGKDNYDFLGGEARYKKSLGRENGELLICALQKPILKLRVEQKLRHIKNALLNISRKRHK